METDSRLLWPAEVMPPLSAAMWTCWNFNNSWSQRQPSGAQLILLMHFSQSLWQQSVGHSLLSLGEVSDAPGTDCPGVETQPCQRDGVGDVRCGGVREHLLILA